MDPCTDSSLAGTSFRGISFEGNLLMRGQARGILSRGCSNCQMPTENTALMPSNP